MNRENRPYTKGRSAVPGAGARAEVTFSTDYDAGETPEPFLSD